MQVGRRFKLWETLNWSKVSILVFLIWGTVPVFVHNVLGWHWVHLPWQPISLIGIAVAFYLGFKNNSSYDRLWEARKIWGGIVNTSRSFAVMARDWVNNDTVEEPQSEEHLNVIRKEIVHRHVAWLHALAIQLRKVKSWEHNSNKENEIRRELGMDFHEDKFMQINPYLSSKEFDYVMSKGNTASHLLSMQSKRIMELRRNGIIEHFRHLEMQALITEMYTLQGKSERIKNFPFPRQYATVNLFFTVLFIVLLPFGMMDVFSRHVDSIFMWLSIPFSVVCSWVFWMMEMIGDYSENPFEGLYNDVPITNIATSIEFDIRQMLDEEDIPKPSEPQGNMNLLM